jgi:hypothetical protein
MGTIGTIAFQTRYGEEARKRRSRLGNDGRETSAEQQGSASVLANSCVAYATD